MIKHPSLTQFYRLLHSRGESVNTLADKIVSGRAHVTQVLNGSRKSIRTQKRLNPLLTDEEKSLLKLCSSWNIE